MQNGQRSESATSQGRMRRAQLVVDWAIAAAASADPMFEVLVPTVVGDKWKSADVTLNAEIVVESLPGGMLTAFPRYDTSEGSGYISVGPPLILDPADPQGGPALVAEIEELFDRIGGDPAATWRVRHATPRAARELPADERWVEDASSESVLERIREVRAGRGGEVAVAIVEAPRWVVRLAVDGHPGDLRVHARLVDRLTRVDRSHSAPTPRIVGDWRLRGDHPDVTLMLSEVRAAILSQTPGAAGLGSPTLAVRLERNASAASTTTSPAKLLGGMTVVGALALLVVWLLVEPTTGFYGSVDAGDLVLVIPFVAVAGVTPAWAAGDVARRVAERLRARWALVRRARDAATVGTYAMWFVAVSLLPSWGAVVLVTVSAAIGYAVLIRRWERRTVAAPT